jgi:Predicted signal transduction protein with a C-terminal ATPase domain
MKSALKKEKNRNRVMRLDAPLRRYTIAKRLLVLFLLVAVVLVFFTGTMIYTSLRNTEANLRSTSAQIVFTLSQHIKQAYNTLDTITKAPVMQAAYGSSKIMANLLADPFASNSDTNAKLQFYTSTNEELQSLITLYDDVAFIALSDLKGNTVYTRATSFLFSAFPSSDYRTTTLSTDTPLFLSSIERSGGMVLSTSPLADGSDFRYPSAYLLGMRALMKLNHLEPIGAMLCCVSLDAAVDYFDMARQYPNQAVAIYSKDGSILLSTMADGMVAQLLAEMPNNMAANTIHQRISWVEGEWTLFHFVYSDSGLLSAVATPYAAVFIGVIQYHGGMMLAILLALAAVILTIRIISRSILAPINRLMRVCERIETGDFSPIEDKGAKDEMHRLIESFNAMFIRIHTLIQEHFVKNELNARMEMQMLRLQINPHMMYNTLDIIRATALSQHNDDLAEMATLLGRTLRYGVTASADPVTIRQEMENLEAYIRLQQLHFHGSLALHICIDPDILDCISIKLLLQPIVENAIYHGVSLCESGGSISILGYAEEDKLIFTVSDTGPGIPSEHLDLLNDYVQGKNQAFTSIGLRNTSQRIRLAYGESYGVSIQSVPGKGTVVTVRIPRVDAKQEKEDTVCLPS